MAAINPPPRGPPKTAFVLGANGYIGFPVSRAFVAAGYKTFGLVRRAEAVRDLVLAEITPVLGTLDDLSFLETLVYPQTKTIDVIVVATEVVPGYAAHFNQCMELVKKLAETSNKNGARPLVLWSSGTKDYGQTPLHGAPDLAPHTEESPREGLSVVKERTENTPRIFQHKDLFDAALIFPTNVYGYSSSYWAAFMTYAADQAASGATQLTVAGDPNTICHALHVDDCATGYVALAAHADRAAVAGELFNISAYRYETADEIAKALAHEYGMAQGVRWITADEAPESFPPGLLFGLTWSQWVSSDKIRRVTGWTDKRALFAQGLAEYRRSYEELEKGGHDNIDAIKHRMGTFFNRK